MRAETDTSRGSREPDDASGGEVDHERDGVQRRCGLDEAVK